MKLKEFKGHWVGRTYECQRSGERLTLTDDLVQFRAFIGVGEGAIDLGDGHYMRIVGNVIEVKDE
jgi:hypothetical protein